MRTLIFEVRGKPQPAGSKRAFVINKGKPNQRAVVADANPKSGDWKGQVAAQAAEAMGDQPLFRVPLRLLLTFHVRRPLGHYGSGKNAGVLKSSAPRYPAKKPDVLKLTRGVEDALSGVVYVDDAQIVEEVLIKRYTDGPEGVDIDVQALEAEAVPALNAELPL